MNTSKLDTSKLEKWANKMIARWAIVLFVGVPLVTLLFLMTGWRVWRNPYHMGWRTIQSIPLGGYGPLYPDAFIEVYWEDEAFAVVPRMVIDDDIFSVNLRSLRFVESRDTNEARRALDSVLFSIYGRLTSQFELEILGGRRYLVQPEYARLLTQEEAEILLSITSLQLLNGFLDFDLTSDAQQMTMVREVDWDFWPQRLQRWFWSLGWF